MKKLLLILFLLIPLSINAQEVWFFSGDTATVPHRLTEFFPNAFYTYQDSVENLRDSLKGTSYLELTFYSDSAVTVGLDSGMATANTYTDWPAAMVFYQVFALRGSKFTDLWIKPTSGVGPITINGVIRIW